MIFGLDEQFAECRMCEVIDGRCEDHFGVTGDVDFPRARPVVFHRQASNLHVVFGRHRDVEPGGDVFVAPLEGGAVR